MIDAWQLQENGGLQSERECRKREREREVAVKKWGVIEMYGANWLKNRYLRLVYDW